MNYKRKSQRPSKQIDIILVKKIIVLANHYENVSNRKYIYKLAK